jgi:hypothetical protein
MKVNFSGGNRSILNMKVTGSSELLVTTRFPEDKGSGFTQNIGTCLLNYVPAYPRRR